MKRKAKPKQEPDLLDKWANVPKFAGKYKVLAPRSSAQKPAESVADQRQTSVLPGKYVPGVGAKKETMQYTGTEMLGVTVLHKSCLQPVFNQEAAIDAARMRR